MTYSTEVIILKKIPWGEADILYTLFTWEKGKIQAIAKGARKIQSKMASHLEPFSLTRVMIARSKSIDKIAGSNLICGFSGIKSNLLKIILASYAWEIVDQFLDQEFSDKRIFRLMKRYLEVLDKDLEDCGQNKFFNQSRLLSRIFILQFFDILGYTPELYLCVHCKKEIKNIDDKNQIHCFCVSHGGLICNNCQKESNVFYLKNSVLKYLRLMLISDIGQFNRFDLSQEDNDSLNKVIDLFLKYRIDRNLKSEKFIENFSKYMKLYN